MIRIATEADVPAILSIYAPYILNTTVTFEYDVPTEAEFLDRFHAIPARYPWLVWEEDGEILGYAHGSTPFGRAAFRWSCEASVYLRSDARGRSIGRQLYTALETCLSAQGHRLCYAIITSENEASLAFHRKIGYAFTAELPACGYKFGRWLGVIWMEKTLNLVESPSSFPTDWKNLCQDTQKISDFLRWFCPFILSQNMLCYAWGSMSSLSAFVAFFGRHTQKNFPFPAQTGVPLLSICSIRCCRTISKNRSPNTFHKEL